MFCYVYWKSAILEFSLVYDVIVTEEIDRYNMVQIRRIPHL